MKTQHEIKTQKTRITKSLLVGLSLGWLIASACNSTTTDSPASLGSSSTSTSTTSASTVTSTSTNTTSVNNPNCAYTDKDFYVVENASCKSNAGLLSRVNPVNSCKEEILTGLDCPVDFVLGSDGRTGYLSVQTNNAVGGYFQEQPGEIYAVDVVSKTKVLMNNGTNRSFVRPAGLAIMENVTQAERDSYCGGNTIDQMIMVVADEGEEVGNTGTSDAGTVWLWCVNTNDYTQSLTPQALLSVGADQMENPRGVAILGRKAVLVSAQSSKDNAGLILVKEMDSTSQAKVYADVFTKDIQDISYDGNGGLLVADAGDGTLSLLDLGAAKRAIISGLNGPADAVPYGVNERGNPTYVATQHNSGNVLEFTFVEDGSAFVDLTSGVTLDKPTGVSR